MHIAGMNNITRRRGGKVRLADEMHKLKKDSQEKPAHHQGK
jgi:hypothetical protein